VLQWEDAGHTGIALQGLPQALPDSLPHSLSHSPSNSPSHSLRDALPDALPNALSNASLNLVPSFVRDAAVPIVLFAGQRAAVRGTATLIRAGQHLFLLTAAHLFDDDVRLGDLALPLPRAQGWVTLAGAAVRRADTGYQREVGAREGGAGEGSDIAVVALPRATQAALAREWCAVSLSAIAAASDGPGASQDAEHPQHYVAGYPAALSRQHQEWLVAKRLLLITGLLLAPPAPATRRDLLLAYSRIAPRTDGTEIHTPALEGVSGAAVWAVCRQNGMRALMIVGVQSSFRHSAYLRAHRVDAARIRRYCVPPAAR